MPAIVEEDNQLILHCSVSKYKNGLGGLIVVHNTSIVCTIVVTNLIVNILLLKVYYLLIKYR